MGTWDNAGKTPSRSVACYIPNTTDEFGMCEVEPYGGIPNKDGNILFRVDNVTFADPVTFDEFAYDAAENHDPDGNSNGTRIRVFFTNSDDYKK